MTVESATSINGLNPNYPQNSDAKSEGAAHIRLLKTLLRMLGGIVMTDKSADYTFVANDANNGFRHPGTDASTRTWTIPANANVAYAVGTCLTFVNQHGAGDLSITITSDVMRLQNSGATGTRTLAANGVATALKIDTTEWLISGSGLT